MSGSLCPDCNQPMSGLCPFCGWSGDASRLPRKILTDEFSYALDLRLVQKQAGLIFVVVVDVEEDSPPHIEATRILGTISNSGPGGRQLYKLPMRPSDEQLQAVRELPGVSLVRLA
jgi:hypothetical protein